MPSRLRENENNIKPIAAGIFKTKNTNNDKRKILPFHSVSKEIVLCTFSINMSTVSSLFLIKFLI